VDIVHQLFVLALKGGTAVQVESRGQHQFDSSVELRTSLAKVSTLVGLDAAFVGCAHLPDQLNFRIRWFLNLG